MPVFADPRLLERAVAALAAAHARSDPTHVLAIESRGFILGAPVALALRLPFVPIRKRGKLPGSLASMAYSLEYGEDTLEIQRDAVGPGGRCVIVDDVLATGGTAIAARNLVGALGARTIGFAFIVALQFLPGLGLLSDERVTPLVVY
jgi:adenine phosphoribosyltransferase